VILPAVLYECETWSLTFREEHILKVFENCVVRRMFKPKRDEERESQRKLHSEELCELSCLRNMITVIKSRGKKSVNM
jgi:hypothetical protein